MDTFKVLVCCHKQTPYIKDSVFTPILLGSAYAEDSVKNAFQEDLWDNMGDNIAQLHPYCAELSSIYWAWKNYETLGNPDYIGLFHYRRFLNFSKPIGDSNLWKCAFFNLTQETRERFHWDEEGIRQFCAGYDLVLPHQEDILDPKDWKTPATLETHYKHSHYPDDFDRAVQLICETYPDYRESVQRACPAKSGYFCNMFVMTRELFFDYAQWLFGIILPLKDILQIDGPKYRGIHESQKRVLGFLGERLFNIWIDHQKHTGSVKICETERLTGYLTEADKRSYIEQYGTNEYRKAVTQSVLGSTTTCAQAEPTTQVLDVVVHDARKVERPAVSVLLPVYNVGEFLRPCIESLINQTLQDIELIFVYDTSQDSSLDILMEYHKKDCRVVVVENKQRGGMSRARNIAMQFIHGEYFAFVDSDDICDATMFEKLYQKSDLLGADITTCSVWGFFDTVDNKYLHRQLEWFGDSDKLLPLAQRPQQLMEPAAWCKLFRREYIQSLDYFEFRPGVVSWEDVPAMTSAFAQTDRIATVQEALYYYRQRTTGNLSNLMTRRYVDEFISGAKAQAEILDKHGPDDFLLQSYIVEFKCLFAEWMLSKLDKKDRPYFFHHVGCLFKWTDRPYLQRLLTLYPKRGLFFYVLLSRSFVVYSLGKFVLRVRRGVKHLIKRTFSIKREGIYRTFKIGPMHFKRLNKAYCTQTIEWLENNVKNIEGQVFRLQAANDELQTANGELHAISNQLRVENSELQAANGVLHTENSELQAANGVLHTENSELQIAGNQLQTVNRELQNANTELQMQSNDLRAALGGYEKMAGGFYYAVWTTGWVDIWKQYYYENYSEIAAKTEALKASLDEASCDLIDRLCYRNFQLLPRQADSKLFLYNHNRIYTEEELAGAAKPLDESYFRKKYVIPEDEYLETSVFAFNCGIPTLPETAIAKIEGRDIIDGGAYWGDSALVLHEYKPRKIYAFEPQPDTFIKLKKTIDDNGLGDDVIAVQCGLGSAHEIRPLYTHGMMSGSSLIDVNPNFSDAEEIVNNADIVTIDAYVEKHALNVGLIKLDIEGNELEAIHGAEETIRRCRPVLDIAVYHHPQDFFEIKPFVERLNLGYRFFVRKLVYHDLVTEVVLLGYSEEEDNL